MLLFLLMLPFYILHMQYMSIYSFPEFGELNFLGEFFSVASCYIYDFHNSSRYFSV